MPKERVTECSKKVVTLPTCLILLHSVILPCLMNLTYTFVCILQIDCHTGKRKQCIEQDDIIRLCLSNWGIKAANRAIINLVTVKGFYV